MASHIQCCRLEESIEFFVADGKKDEGENRKKDQQWSVDEFLRAKVTQHCYLIEDQRSHDADEHVGPHPPIALV